MLVVPLDHPLAERSSSTGTRRVVDSSLRLEYLRQDHTKLEHDRLLLREPGSGTRRWQMEVLGGGEVFQDNRVYNCPAFELDEGSTFSNELALRLILPSVTRLPRVATVGSGIVSARCTHEDIIVVDLLGAPERYFFIVVGARNLNPRLKDLTGLIASQMLAQDQRWDCLMS